MTSDEATRFIGRRIGVQHGDRFLTGILERVHKPRHSHGVVRMRADVRLRDIRGDEAVAMFDVDQLADLNVCTDAVHVWHDDADTEGDTCTCGAWYRFKDRIERTPEIED